MRIRISRYKDRFRVAIDGKRMPSAKPIQDWSCDDFAKHKALSCMTFMATAGCHEIIGEFYEP